MPSEEHVISVTGNKPTNWLRIDYLGHLSAGTPINCNANEEMGLERWDL